MQVTHKGTQSLLLVAMRPASEAAKSPPDGSDGPIDRLGMHNRLVLWLENFLASYKVPIVLLVHIPAL